MVPLLDLLLRGLGHPALGGMGVEVGGALLGDHKARVGTKGVENK